MQHAYRHDIQILRALAVSLVFLYHLNIPLFRNGFLGVDMFFVVSGYLMFAIFPKRSVLAFYSARIKRLALPAIFVLVVSMIYFGATTLPFESDRVVQETVWGVAFLSNFLYWNEASYFANAFFRPFLNYWSLSLEMQFYLFFPIVWILFAPRGWITQVGIIGVAFVLCLGALTISPKTAFFLMPFRLWEFLLGGLAFLQLEPALRTLKSQHKHMLSSVAIVAILGLILGAQISPNNRALLQGHPSSFALIICILTAVVLSLKSNSLLGFRCDGQFLKPVVTLGNISYSLYLVHFPIIAAFGYQAFSSQKSTAFSALETFFIMLLSLVLATISYQTLEKRKIGFRTWQYLAFIVLLFGSSQIILNWSKTYRFDERERAVFNAMDDIPVYRCGKLFRILQPTSELCQINSAEQDAAVLLIGNSHMDSIKSNLTQVFGSYDVRVYMSATNPPIFSPSATAEILVEKAKSVGATKLLIHFADVYSIDHYNQELARALSVFSANGLRVAVVGPVPYYEISVPQQLHNQLRQADKSDAPSKASPKDLAQMTNSFQKLANAHSNTQGLAFFPVAQSFCDQAKCVIATENWEPLYFDSNHLTSTGADHLAQDLVIAVNWLFAN